MKEGKYGDRALGLLWKESRISDRHKVWEMLIDECIEVTDINACGESYVVRYNKTCNDLKESNVVNIPIAAFTTAYARVRL